jgi:hypothetical protein
MFEHTWKDKGILDISRPHFYRRSIKNRLKENMEIRKGGKPSKEEPAEIDM